MRKKNIEELQNEIGYTFKDISLLDEAFTHSSVEQSANKNYERLEFLGDALINLVIADYFYGTYPDYSEGKLTQLKSNVVNGETLSQVSKRNGLGDYISLGKGLVKQGAPDSIFCDVVEAMCAAVFLDAGIRFAREFVIALFEDEIEQASSMQKDAKSRLQEIVQKESRETPQYEIVDISGQEHAKVFTATVSVSGIVFGPCECKTKKQAEQNAALVALKAFLP